MPIEAAFTLVVIGLTLVGLYREFLSPDLLLLGARVTGAVRDGECLSGDVGDVELEAGDTLLLEGQPGFTETFRDSPDFFLVQQRQEEEKEERIPRPIAAAGILGGVGGALVTVGSHFGAVGVLAAGVGGTMLLTATITNNAAIALMVPVVAAAASAQGLDVRPFVIGITVAASTAFVTPLGYQTNLMVYGPGGYRFGDFARAGALLQLLVAALILAVVPVVWGL